MAIHIALHHRTTYNYDRLINVGPQTIRLRPAPHCRTKILSYSLKVQPSNHFLNWQQDPHSNYLARAVFPEPTNCFDVMVDLVAEMSVYNPFDFFLEPYAEESPFVYEPLLKKDLAPFMEWPKLGPELVGLIQQWSGKPKMRTIDFLVAINTHVHQLISYTIRMEPGVQTPEETLKLASGSCRDSSWLLVNVLRGLGFAARFASGYLIQLKPDVKSLDGPSGAEKDFTDLHAWCEVYLPGAGWVGLDPTSGLFAGEGHIPVACTPDPVSAAPISGLLDPCETEMHHEMNITRVHESPRVTKPYTEEQWQRILEVGRAVDKRLIDGDVRLTMGGEPTFVSVDDPDGPEWNFTANSVKKRELSGELIKRLRERFAANGGLLHYGQGKWYPGEPLPRWALGCWWRKDGEPIWENPDLIADEKKDYGYTEKEAKILAEKLIENLGVDNNHLIPAYEDIYYYIWKERRLPSNVDPLKNNLEDEQERERLRRIFEQGLGSVVGYTLPLKRYNQRWVSGPWFLRRETLYLLPGDSPMGLRLPLDSLPWVASGEYPWNYDRDPMEELPPLPPRQQFQRSGKGEGVGEDTPNNSSASRARGHDFPGEEERGPWPSRESMNPPKFSREPNPGESAPWIIRTGLCVEPRNGRLHIFIPPVDTTEDYLNLVAAIESTAAELDMPVILEGTPPAYDPRLKVLKVTPDPGVIEVNLHPSATWDELVDKTKTIYDEAHLTRLGTEKFMLDGHHTGTGGGNHIIIGGERPSDSPILRRPDLLKSLLGYWQNHPSLSYLFSGLFIGPTSQAPRIDEARNDSIYELDLAFKQMPERGGNIPPWLVDRLFRNLLTDSTGNTHRAEFSIDKLYDPDSSTGRLGLLEMRSYEMPPHAEMSLAQHLLLRSLVAKFWEQPYKGNLVRWGTDIHDRWMLPHFLWSDFTDVISDLKSSGFPLQEEWFAPHLEFRCPYVGEFSQRNVNVELRTALEPWHVLGEEGAQGGTVRYVDSSLERLQIKVEGMIDPRHVLTVNGRTLPLHPTGVNGEYVCGVRFRAWQPPNCLHPLIGIHAPMTFDLVDTWNKRSMGGCRYHVTHPGGLSYDNFPVNAYTAESRRLARFESIGHSWGPMEPSAPVRSREFPFTMDLRA